MCGFVLFFVVIFSGCILLVISGRVRPLFVLVFLPLQSNRCDTRNFHLCNLPDHIPSSLRSSCSFLHFIFVDPLSALETNSSISVFYFWVLPHTEEFKDCAPELWAGLSWTHHLTTVRSACFGTSHDSTVIFFMLDHVLLKRGNLRCGGGSWKDPYGLMTENTLRIEIPRHRGGKSKEILQESWKYDQ